MIIKKISCFHSHSWFARFADFNAVRHRIQCMHIRFMNSMYQKVIDCCCRSKSHGQSGTRNYKSSPNIYICMYIYIFTHIYIWKSNGVLTLMIRCTFAVGCFWYPAWIRGVLVIELIFKGIRSGSTLQKAISSFDHPVCTHLVKSNGVCWC